MKIITLTLAISFLIFFPNKLYSQWETLYFSAGTTVFPNIESISFSDELNGYCVGINTMSEAILGNQISASSIIKTTNGGINWEDVYVIDTFRLHDIIHVNSSVLFSVGSSNSNSHGIIVRSIDNGQNWDTTIVSDGLVSISFPNDNIGYSCGLNGTVLKTINSGQDWVVINTLNSSNLKTCEFINDSVGFIGTYTELFRTTNGGVTWNSILLTNYYQLGDLFFSSDSIGYYVINSNDANQIINIYKTIDCGLQWNQTSSLSGMSASSLFFTSDSVGYVVGQFVVEKTVDGGYTWVPHTANPPGWVNFMDDILDVFFVNNTHGFIAGWNQFYRTDIGGGGPYLNTKPLLNNEVEIYPNPFMNNLNISQKNFENSELKIYSITGNLIIQDYYLGNKEIQINTSELPKGLYILTLTSNRVTQKFKIIKE